MNIFIKKVKNSKIVIFNNFNSFWNDEYLIMLNGTGE